MALLDRNNPIVEETRAAQLTLIDGYATGPALSPREIVENSLPLANVGLSMKEIERAVTFLRGHSAVASGSDVHLEPLGSLRLPKSKRLALAREREERLTRALWREVGEYSDWFRDALTAIIADREKARRDLRGDLDASVGEIVVAPRLLWDGNAPRIELFYFWRNITGLFGYVLMCLLDEGMELGQALRICKYDGCDRLFLSFPPPTGGPRPSYCSPDHRIAALREGGAERVKEYRKRQRKARKPK